MSTAQLNHTPTVGTSSRARVWLARRPLATFFVLAFALSWPWLIADALGSRGFIPFRLMLSGPGIVLVLLMSYGPTFAALLVTWAIAGRAGMRTLIRLLLPWRAGLHWYVTALAGPAALAISAAKLQEFLGATLRPLPGPPLQLVLMGVVASVIHGIANGEEIGWRGFALPRLQARHDALTASLILGTIWAAFHIPIMFTLGGVGGSQSFATALPFLAGALAMSIVVTWIFITTRGSLLPIILLHGAMNTWPDLFAQTGNNAAEACIGIAPMILLAAALVLVCGPAHLSREPAAALPVEQAVDHR